MKNSILALVALFSLLFLTITAQTYAEMYKYVDENGQTRWTDDLGQVPKAYREAVQMVESIEPEPESLDASQTGDDNNIPLDSQSEESNKDVDSASNAQLDPTALEKERADLDAFYRELQEERKTIEQLKQEEGDTEAQKELNIRITEFNQKTQQYEMKLSQFNERVKAYNQQINE